MKDIQAYAIGRFGGYGSAMLLVAVVLSGCSSIQTAMDPPKHTTTLREVHMEYHKKMLASQKVNNLKVSGEWKR